MRFSDWKQNQNLSVVNLMLDPRNPRLPEADVSLSQNEILRDLVRHEKVFELAKNIVEKGYYPGESIIVFPQNGKKYVVEGNRRVAALKLLISPEGAPKEDFKKFKALSAKVDSNEIRKVRAVIAPSREAAYPVMMDKHTQSIVEKWEPLMQAKLYKNLIDSGLPVDHISDEYKLPISRIRDLLRRYEMYSIACILDLPDEVLGKVNNPRVFPVTTLDRFFAYSEVLKFLGISFNENKELVGKISVNEFKKGYTKIVYDVATAEVKSRTVNNRKDMERYLREKFKENEIPNTKKKGSFTAQTFLGPGATKTKRTFKKKTTAKKMPRKSRGIIPSRIKCFLNNQRINDVYEELRKIKVESYPNAVGLVLRSFLEMSLDHYLNKAGHLTKLKQKEKEKRVKKGLAISRDWHPPLSEVIKYIVNDAPEIIDNKKVLVTLSKLVSEKDSIVSIDTMNQFVHNQYFAIDEPRLRTLWQQLEPVFEIILVEPEPEIGKN